VIDGDHASKPLHDAVRFNHWVEAFGLDGTKAKVSPDSTHQPGYTPPCITPNAYGTRDVTANPKRSAWKRPRPTP
jgi:hypothetical protein